MAEKEKNFISESKYNSMDIPVEEITVCEKCGHKIHVLDLPSIISNVIRTETGFPDVTFKCPNCNHEQIWAVRYRQ